MPTSWQARYTQFTPNLKETFSAEFGRLAVQQKWKKGSKIYRNEWRKCITEEFSAHYGRDASKLENWQALCFEVGMEDIPRSITACKKALRGVWVNLVDLIDCRRTGKQVTRHASANALRKYIKDTGKVFPKQHAKKDGFLAALLITLYK